jgi:hypothetical protein
VVTGKVRRISHYVCLAMHFRAGADAGHLNLLRNARVETRDSPYLSTCDTAGRKKLATCG